MKYAEWLHIYTVRFYNTNNNNNNNDSKEFLKRLENSEKYGYKIFNNFINYYRKKIKIFKEFNHFSNKFIYFKNK